jgi:dihydrofolate reductase
VLPEYDTGNPAMQWKGPTMRKTVNSTFISLDGVVNHMERWHFDFVDDESNAVAMEQLADADALLLGRATYEAYAAVWPGRDDDYAKRINRLPKYVASTTLQEPTWENTSVLRGDLVEAVRSLKSTGDGTILMHGYGPVARTLVGAGLLDELHLWVHPVQAGVGGPDDMLFQTGEHARWELDGTHVFASGVVLLSYRAAR